MTCIGVTPWQGILALAFVAILQPAWGQKTPQTVSFTAPIPEEITPDRYIALSAQASSGLPVSFTAGGGCRLVNLATGPHVYVHSLGTCSILAIQEGDGVYEAASATASVRVTWLLRLTAPPAQGVGDLVSVTFAYGDEAPAREVVCAIDWNDPAAPEVELGTFSSFYWNKYCTYGHRYSSPGIYSIHAAFLDPEFGYALGTAEVLVFDRDAVAVTGQGSYHSRRGSFMRAPELSGNVLFHIDARIAGPTVSGTVWFALEGTDARFWATELYSIVPRTSHFTVHGVGRDHEGHLWSFEAEVTDARGSGIDTIRFVLRDGSGTVYDSEGPGSTAPPPTTPLAWGDVAVFY